MSRTSANPPEWSAARFATQATNRKLDNNVTSYVQVCVDGPPRATTNSAFRPKFKGQAELRNSRTEPDRLVYKEASTFIYVGKRAELKAPTYVENPPKSYTLAETTVIEVAMKCMINTICAQCTIYVHMKTAYVPSVARIFSYSYAHGFRYLSIPAQ